MWRSTWKYSESQTGSSGSTSCAIVATLPLICIHPSIDLSIYLLPLFATPPAKGHARHDRQEDRHNGNRLCSARGSLVLSPGSRIASDQRWRGQHTLTCHEHSLILLIPSPDWMCSAIPHLCWVCISQSLIETLHISDMRICNAFDEIPLKISVVFYKMPYHHILLKLLVHFPAKRFSK